MPGQEVSICNSQTMKGSYRLPFHTMHVGSRLSLGYRRENTLIPPWGSGLICWIRPDQEPLSSACGLSEWMFKKKKKWRNLRNAFHMGRFLKSIHPFEELERSRSYSPRLRLWKKEQGRLFVSTEHTPGQMCLPLSPWVNQQHLLGFLFRATRTGSLGKSFSMAVLQVLEGYLWHFKEV